MGASAKPAVIGSLGDAGAIAAFIRAGDQKAYDLIAHGSVPTHILNGPVMGVVVDDDAKNRRAASPSGVQVHVGPPMKTEFRPIRLKTR